MVKARKQSAEATGKKRLAETGPLISIIIPAFRSVGSLEQCLESILHQTHQNFEIIVAAKSSTPEKKARMQKFAEQDSRIQIALQSANSYMDCVSRANGMYVSIINPEDAVSIDFLRRMSETARKENLDIVISDMLFRDLSGQLFYYNLDPLRLESIEYCGTEIQSQYLRVASLCASWNVLGNKLFRKDLLIKCIRNIKKFNADSEWESVCLLPLLMSSARKLKNIHHVYYIQGVKTMETDEENAEDLHSFEWAKAQAVTVNSIFQNLSSYMTLSEQEQEWLKRLHMYYLNTILEQVGQTPIRSRLIQLPEFYEQEGFTEKDRFFQSLCTPLTPAFHTWEKVKEAIANPKIKCVSFDIFDTLILRNVLEPTDIFSFLNQDFNRLFQTKSFIDFSEIRKQCEVRAREVVFKENPSFEDITLDEIYDQMKEGFLLEPSEVDLLKEKECELELRFCIPRQTGKELYDLAKYCGKQVILVSDMYLPKAVIEKILYKNGYSDYDHLFLSSEQRLGKYTCNLFKRVKREMHLDDQQAIHIGDNWIVDVCNAEKTGFLPFHLPKPLDLLRHNNPGIFTGNFYTKIFAPNGSWIDGRCAADLFHGIRGMLALTANRFFDFPYENFLPETDFNANPCFVGYFAVGMHLYALTEWLTRDAKRNHYKKIHFLARDGYLPLQAYRIITQDDPTAPSASYTYMSRHLIALCDIEKPVDMYTLAHKMNIMAAAPKKLFKMFQPAIPKNVFENAEKLLLENGFIYDKPFRTMDAYYKFVPFFAGQCVDFDLLHEYQKKLRNYFTSIFAPTDCFFDVGYNGRVESALTAICGYEMHSYYLHAYREIAMNRAEQQGFTMRTFFDYQPVTTFLVREQVFSKLAPSAVGIDFSASNPEVLFGDYDVDTQEEIVTQIMQQAAIDFVRDFKTIFSGVENYMHYRFIDASLPFEFFMHHAMEKDRHIFKPVSFEDEFGEETVFNLCDYWGYNLYLFAMNTGTLPTAPVIRGDEIYHDGLFMKFYHFINRRFPKGSSKREMLKKFVSVFIH